MNRFNQLFSQKKKVFIPFFMLGDPNPDASFEIIKSAIDAGCHALELGIPFSDPVADGPTIQGSAERALKAKTNFATCIELIKKIRAYTGIPIGMLIYFNLLYRQGLPKGYHLLKEAGVDAVLLVDLPHEELKHQYASIGKAGLGIISLVAPNTPLIRAIELIKLSTAFTYVISDYGTTGVRKDISEETKKRIRQLREIGDDPLVIGFGISRAEHVKAVCDEGADGAIMGSALAKVIDEDQGDVDVVRENVWKIVKECLESIK